MPNSARIVVDVGTVIAETYRIEALIGRGGMGSVFLASHARLPGKQVAIKLLHSDETEGEVIARFKREAEIASRLGHPNIVGVTDFNVLPDGTPYLVLEYLEGQPLSSRLREGPLSLEAVFSIARQVGSALAAAHREGIVHRDLKPANIFLVPTEIDGKLVEIAKVLDFGISKMRGSTTVKTQEYTLLGTPQYMAPEQAKGDHANVDERTDIFALGSILYEMLAGEPAFTGANIPEVCFKVVYEEPRPLLEVAPAAPAAVLATVVKAMAKAPEDRFASVGELVEQLTGTPLASTPSKSGISLPPVDAEGAFAHTAPSGERSLALSTPRVRAPTPVPDVRASATGATVQSLPPTPVPPAVLPPRRSLAAVLGIAVASAAIGALVLYLVTRGGAASPPVDAPVIAIAADGSRAAADVAESADARADVPADAPADAPADVPADAHADTPADAANAPPRDAGRVAPDPSTTADDRGPRAAAVAQAVKALAARDYDVAERLAGEVIFSDDATGAQRIRARSVRAVVYCVARFHEERAGIDLKAIPTSYRGLRKEVLARCHAAGFLGQITE